MQGTQINTQSQNNKYSLCLIVTRHQLLEMQKKDVENICSQHIITPELPTNPQQVRELIKPYDVIIGIIPLPMQIQILQNKKKYISFVMESLGITDSKEEAQTKASQYPGRAVVLPPSKEGERFRVTLYEGLKLIKEIKVVDEWLIQHQS